MTLPTGMPATLLGWIIAGFGVAIGMWLWSLVVRIVSWATGQGSK